MPFIDGSPLPPSLRLRLDLTKDRVASLQLLALSFLDLSGLWRCPTELHALVQLVMGHFDHSYGQVRPAARESRKIQPLH